MSRQNKAIAFAAAATCMFFVAESYSHGSYCLWTYQRAMAGICYSLAIVLGMQIVATVLAAMAVSLWIGKDPN